MFGRHHERRGRATPIFKRKLLQENGRIIFHDSFSPARRTTQKGVARPKGYGIVRRTGYLLVIIMREEAIAIIYNKRKLKAITAQIKREKFEH